MADLVQALAGGLVGGVITAEELIGHVRKGTRAMEKIVDGTNIRLTTRSGHIVRVSSGASR